MAGSGSRIKAIFNTTSKMSLTIESFLAKSDFGAVVRGRLHRVRNFVDSMVVFRLGYLFFRSALTLSGAIFGEGSN